MMGLCRVAWPFGSCLGFRDGFGQQICLRSILTLPAKLNCGRQFFNVQSTIILYNIIFYLRENVQLK